MRMLITSLSGTASSLSFPRHESYDISCENGGLCSTEHTLSDDMGFTLVGIGKDQQRLTVNIGKLPRDVRSLLYKTIHSYADQK